MTDHSSVTLIGGKFRWDDPLLIEEQLTDEERLFHSMTRGTSFSCA